MANLLGFLKRVGNTVNNDVVSPINRDVVQPINRNVVQPAEHFVQPTVQSVPGLIGGTAQALETGPAFARGLVGLATHNPVAASNAFHTASQDFNQVKGLAQFLPRAATQVGLSAYQGLHPGAFNGGAGTLTPSNKAERILLGNQPVQSFSNLANQTKGGTATKQGTVALNALGDALALKGGIETGKKIVENNTPLNQIGAIGKNVTSPSPSPGKTPAKSLTPDGVPTKASREVVQNANTKENKFIGTVRNSNEVSPTVQKAVSGTYVPGTNAEKLAISDKLVNGDLTKATNQTLASLNQTTGRIKPQQISDAIAVAKAHDASGNFEQASQIYDKLAQHGTAAGQKVQALSLLSNRTPDGLHYSAVKTLKNVGVDASGKLGDAIKANIDAIKNTAPGSPERDITTQQLVHTVNNAIPRSKAAAAVGIWRAGLLTGPETFAKVAASYGISAPGEIASKLPSALVDKALAHTGPLQDFLNRNNPNYIPGQRSITASPSDLLAGSKGALRGAQAIPTKLKSGIDIPNTGGFPQALGKGSHLTPYEDKVMGAHGAIPKVGFSGIHDMTLAEQARTTAMNEGLKGSALRARTAELRANPTQAMKDVATKDAEFATNMNDTALGSMAQKIQGASIKTASGNSIPIGKILVPFSRVPSSIATKGIVDYTPLGLGKAASQFFNGLSKGTIDQRAFSQAIGRSTTGTGTAVLAGAALMKAGKMTLAAPSDPKEAALWKAEGKQKNSIQIGGKWISLNAFGPAGIALGFGGAYTKGGVGQAAASAGKLTADQPYFKGIEGVANALSDPTRYAQSFYDSTVGSVIPAAVQQTARGTDTSQRAYTPGVKTTLQSEIPGQRQKLPVQKNLYGETLPGANPSGSILGGALGTINPFYPSTPRNTNDPATQELQRLYSAQGSGGTPAIAPPTSLSIQGHPAKANSANINILESTAGPVEKQAINQLVQSPAYQALPDANKTNAINQILTQAKQNAIDTNATSFKLNPSKAGTNLPPVQNLSAGGSLAPNTSKALSAQQLSLDRQAFANSGKNYQEINGRVYTADAPLGTPKIQYDYNVGTATLVSKKNAGDLNGWIDTANKQLDSIKKQLSDPNIDPLTATKLQNDASTLQTNIDKYKSYGGFTKYGAGGKPKTFSGSFSTASKTSTFKPPKGIRVRVAKGNFKAPSTRKLAVSKIPSNYLGKRLG